MLTSYSKKRYQYLKENFDELYPSINEKVLCESSIGEKVVYALATLINLYCLYQTIMIMCSLTFFYKLTALVSAYIVGDIVSGVVHWIPDSYDIHPFMLTYPYLSTVGHVLQESFDGFRLHHIQPHRIVTHTLFNTAGSTYVFVSFIQMLVMLLNLSPWSSVFIGIIAFVNIFSNEFHKISHMNTNQMSFIQKIINATRLFLTKERHRDHHVFESEVQGFTMLSGLSNPILDHPKIRLWDRLEQIMYFLFQIKSHRMINNEIKDAKDLEDTKDSNDSNDSEDAKNLLTSCPTNENENEKSYRS